MKVVGDPVKGGPRRGLLKFSKLRRTDGLSKRDQWFARIERDGCVRCPDCNAESLTRAGLGMHKATGGCVVIPGARERAAQVVVEYIMGILVAA